MEKITFENLPSTNTPLNATNLNLLQTNVENAINGYVLYNNDTGSVGTITLSDSAANYDYIEIFYSKNRAYNSSTKIYKPNGKTASLITGYRSGSNFIQMQIAIIEINGTSITKTAPALINFDNGVFNIFDTDEMSIHRVVGYKG